MEGQRRAVAPEKYRDEYRLRVLAMVDAKIKGRQIVATPITRKSAPVIDLAEHEERVPEKKLPALARRERPNRAGKQEVGNGPDYRPKHFWRSRPLPQRGYAHRGSICGLGCSSRKCNRSMALNNFSEP
jgi:hypothetical protein